MRRNKALGVTAALGAALLATGCGRLRNVPVDVPSGPRAPQGVEGEWISSDRVAVSRFGGGVFTTTATDTGEKLSEGNYTSTGPNAVTIKGVSLARQRRNLPADVSFNCLLVQSSQLNCTGSAGQQFVLVRRTAGAA